MKQVISQDINEYLTHLGQFGQLEAGGVTRFVYDAAWIAAMNFVLQDAKFRGMNVAVDKYGNGFMSYPGINATQIVAAGSHLDTVNKAGIYDGSYGMAAAILAMSDLFRQYGQPQKTMTAVAFSEEEGSRFPVSFSGSKHYSKTKETDPLIKDCNGITFGSARHLALQQLTTKYLLEEQPLPSEFFELHIEQGPILEEKGLQLGVVSSICEQKRFTVTLHGQTNHAGTTPQHLRKDALKAAVRLIYRLEKQAQYLGEPFVFTVGEFVVSPGSSNVIPGLVRFSVDIRHPDKKIVDGFEDFLRTCAAALSAFTVEVYKWMDSLPAKMDKRLVKQFQKIITARGLDYLNLPSGAGHDTQIMNLKVPTAMLFVPSKAGISHAPAEFTSPKDLALGVEILKDQLYEECYH